MVTSTFGQLGTFGFRVEAPLTSTELVSSIPMLERVSAESGRPPGGKVLPWHLGAVKHRDHDHNPRDVPTPKARLLERQGNEIREFCRDQFLDSDDEVTHDFLHSGCIFVFPRDAEPDTSIFSPCCQGSQG